MTLQSDVLTVVAATAQRVSAEPSEDARDLAWWVMRLLPALDRIVTASAPLSRSPSLDVIGRALDSRNEAVHSLLRLLGAPRGVA